MCWLRVVLATSLLTVAVPKYCWYGAARENVRKAVLVEPGPWPDASKKLDKVDLPETLIVWGDDLMGTTFGSPCSINCIA